MDKRNGSRTRTSMPGQATESRDSMLRQVIAGLEELPNDASFTQIKAVLDLAALRTVPDPIRRRALEVFGGEEKTGEWLTTKIAVLGGQTPMDILISTEGEKEVLAILDRIEHGVFS